MKFMRFAGSLSVACGLSLTLASGAFASTDVTNTGAGSDNEVSITNVTDSSTTNVNTVVIANESLQNSTSGSVLVSSNTNAGGSTGLVSGEATNNNTTSQVVSIGNDTNGGAPQGGDQTPGGGGPSNDNSAPVVAGQNGSVLGVSAGRGAGSAVLPVTGPLSPVDVSALRAAFDAGRPVLPVSVAKQTSTAAGLVLTLAALLSLAGAVGTAVYGRRKEGKV